MKVVAPSAVLLHATPYPAHVIEAAGRTCYQSHPQATRCPECDGAHHVAVGSNVLQQCSLCGDYGTAPESAEAFTRMVLARGHESVVEHVSAGVLIMCDRGVSHEVVRHRLATYSQESTRYCDYAAGRFGGELSFVAPPGLTALQQVTWTGAMRDAEQRYLDLRQRCGDPVPPELARSVLPTALKTALAMTCNAREWRHFLRLRLAPPAHPQMRQVARLIAKVLMGWCAPLFDDVVMGASPVVGAPRAEGHS